MSRLLYSWRVLLLLAWPVMLSRLGILVMALTDVAMVGRVSTAELGYLGLGNVIFLPIMITGIGAMIGIIAVTSQYSGKGDAQGQVATFYAGTIWGSVLGLIALVLTWNVGLILPLLGHMPDLVSGGQAVSRALAPGALFQILFVTCAFWLEGTGRTRPALIAMIAANLVNVAGNLVLIPMMAAEGAAIATTIARAAALAIVAYTVFCRPEMRKLPARGTLPLRPIIVIGLAGGVAFMFETVAFSALGNIAGLIGPQALAAYTIVHNLEATVFMVALGLSIAAAVLTGRAAGSGDFAQARYIALSAVALTMLLLATLMSLVVIFAEPVARIFTDEEALILRIGPLIAVLAISLTFDGAQVVMGQCTRALGDAWQTTLRYFIGFWCVMIPMGYVLGLKTDLAEMGLFIATGAGCAVTAGLLWLRLNALVRMRQEQMSPRARLTDISHYLSNGILRVMARVLRLFPYTTRLKIGSWITRNLLMRLPMARRRVEANLDLIMPNADRADLLHQIGDNFGRVMVEEMMMAEVISDPSRFRVSGPGLDALIAAQAEGRGAIIVSAHYGNWEAARTSALNAGVEIAGVYRAHNNPYYNADFVATLRTLSPNAFSKGRQGTRDLIKHLRGGGVAEILVDQKQSGAPLMDFLGHPAETTLTAAKLARSMDIPLIPVISFRAKDGVSFDSVFAAPIMQGTEVEMMQAVNDQLSAWIMEKPGQWFWFHRRWR